MRYDYECEPCQRIIETDHSIKEDPEFLCPKCGTKMSRVITGGSGFILKGFDGWTSKNVREAGVRAKRNSEKESRTRERLEAHNIPKLAPNVEGERVESWSDAKKLARSKGYNSDTYTPLVESEKKG